MKPAQVKVTARRSGTGYAVMLENHSNVPAVFIRLELVDARGQDITPVTWEDNYVTMSPKATMKVNLSFDARQRGAAIEMSGVNMKLGKIVLGQ